MDNIDEQITNMDIEVMSLQDARSNQEQTDKSSSKKSKKDVIYNIGGINFYDKKEMLYTQYEKGKIAIAANMFPNSSSQCFSLFSYTIEVENFVMAQEPHDRNFYEVCLFLSGNNIRDYPFKLVIIYVHFFDFQ